MKMHTAEGTLAPVRPFDFDRTLDYLRWFRPLAMEQAVSGGEFTKAFRTGDQTVLCQISNRGHSPSSELSYALRSPAPLTEEVISALLARVRIFLSLEDDVREFYALADGDPVFYPIIQSLYGYHQVRFPSPFEATVWAILSQRNRMTTARNMMQHITERFGHPMSHQGVTYWAFPQAEELAACEEGDLAFVARNLRRGEFLIDAARSFSTIPPEYLNGLSYDDAEAWLLDIKGIGPWSAGFILLRGMGRYDRIPREDRVIVDAVTRFYGDGRTVTPAEIRRLAARYGKWQGYWAHYLRLALAFAQA